MQPYIMQTWIREIWDMGLESDNWTTSRFEPRLVYMHTQKPKKLISNVR